MREPVPIAFGCFRRSNECSESLKPSDVNGRLCAAASNGTIDYVTGTDGVDVTTSNAGPRFEQGLLIVHDEANPGGTTSNLKYVPLGAVPR